MIVRPRLIRAGPKFYIAGDNPELSWKMVDCKLYILHSALKNEYLKKDMVASTPMELDFCETLAKTFINPA